MNEEIRSAAKANGIYLWQIASELGVSEPTIYRWLRFPLAPEREQAMLDVIYGKAKEALNGSN